MVYAGGCQCGMIRYEADGEPASAGLCECRMCQRATGAFGLADARFERDRLRWTRGQPKRFASSNLADRGFCAACGTTLTYENRRTGTVSILLATLDDPEAIVPTRHDGIEGRPSWFADVLALPGAPTEAPSPDFIDHQYQPPRGQTP